MCFFSPVTRVRNRRSKTEPMDCLWDHVVTQKHLGLPCTLIFRSENITAGDHGGVGVGSNTIA